MDRVTTQGGNLLNKDGGVIEGLMIVAFHFMFADWFLSRFTNIFCIKEIKYSV